MRVDGRLVKAAVVTLLSVVWASTGWAWRTDVQGTVVAGMPDRASAVALDGLGNPVVGGYISSLEGGPDFAVLKFDRASGDELWRYTVDGGAGFSDEVTAIAVDPNGDVVAAGYFGTGEFQSVMAVVKLDGATGSELWRRVINGTATGGTDRASAVVVDTGGDVIVVGWVKNLVTNYDFAVVKLDGATGAERWRQMINSPGNGDDFGTGVGLDANGDIIAAGGIADDPPRQAFAVIKVDGESGTERWRRLLRGTGPGSAVANAVAVTSTGDAVAVGVINNAGTNDDFAVFKLDGSTGTERWRTVIDGGGGLWQDVARSVALDAQGDVVAGGTLNPTGQALNAILKLDGASGGQRWRAFVPNTRVAVDGTGDVVAAGNVPRGTDFIDYDFVIVKLSGTTGIPQWQSVQDGTRNRSDDKALDVAVTASGDVIAVGFVENERTGYDFCVAAVAGGPGTLLWRRDIDGHVNGSHDQANAVALDPIGNVLAAGYLENEGHYHDFSVAKLDGDTGTKLWRADLYGTVIWFNTAEAVVSDASGNAVVAGTIFNAGTTDDFAVAKFDGETGALLWRQEINGTFHNSSDHAHGVAVDSTTGDAIAVGITQNGGDFFIGDFFTVVRLDAATGNILWRFDLNASALARDEGRAVVLDSAGDVIAVGHGVGPSLAPDMAVVKLDGASGSERWRAFINIPGPYFRPGEARTVTVDADNNVIVGGFLEPWPGTKSFSVVKLSGTTGEELWRYMVDPGRLSESTVMSLTVDVAGDVIAGGSMLASYDAFSVVKLDGATGAELWRTTFAGPAGIGWAAAIAVDMTGDIFATGVLPGVRTDFIVLKLDGATGGEIWRRTFARTQGGPGDAGRALVVDTAGEVVAAGVVQNRALRDQFTVIKLRGVDGGDF